MPKGKNNHWARERRHEEGIDFSNNMLRGTGNRTFGQSALGPLTDDCFSIAEQEQNFIPNHLASTFEEYQEIIERDFSNGLPFDDESVEEMRERLLTEDPCDPIAIDDYYDS